MGNLHCTLENFHFIWAIDELEILIVIDKNKDRYYQLVENWRVSCAHIHTVEKSAPPNQKRYRIRVESNDSDRHVGEIMIR